MNTSVFENRRALLASIALAGALAVALLSIASAAQGGARAGALYPRSTTLTDDKIAHWAVLMRRTVVRTKPSLGSRMVTILPAGTTDGTQNDVLALSRIDISPRSSWYRVRLPILPNNSIGYVRKSDLSPLFSVNTHLYINRGATTATLKRNGQVVFKTRITTPSTPSTPCAAQTSARLEKRSSTSVSRPAERSTSSAPPSIAVRSRSMAISRVPGTSRIARLYPPA